MGVEKRDFLEFFIKEDFSVVLNLLTKTRRKLKRQNSPIYALFYTKRIKKSIIHLFFCAICLFWRDSNTVTFGMSFLQKSGETRKSGIKKTLLLEEVGSFKLCFSVDAKFFQKLHKEESVNET